MMKRIFAGILISSPLFAATQNLTVEVSVNGACSPEYYIEARNLATGETVLNNPYTCALELPAAGTYELSASDPRNLCYPEAKTLTLPLTSGPVQLEGPCE